MTTTAKLIPDTILFLTGKFSGLAGYPKGYSETKIPCPEESIFSAKALFEAG